jgi:septum formation protein
MSACDFSPGLQGPFRPCKPLILASASPRRQALLAQLGLHFQVQPSTLSEPPPDPGETALNYVQRMAWHKAKDAGAKKKPGVILTADTVVALGKEILGKPDSFAQALAMLSRLNGCTHFVHTGCCLFDQQGTHPDLEFAVSTQVTFFRHTQDILAAYVRTGEPIGKAGSYAIQGIGAFLVSHIYGSYTNVVGLPLSETVSALLKTQAICLEDSLGENQP